jgi:acetyl esterase/lipase
MLYFHQGGNVIGDLDTCEAFCSLIAERARCYVLSVDYRLAPEHKFPAAADDAIAAYRWAREHAKELGADPGRLAVGGDSAGGGLSAVVTHALKKAGEPQPLLQLLIYPWVTAASKFPSYETYGDAFPLNAAMMDWFANYYFNGEAERSDTRASPLREEDFGDLAPAQIITAGFDPLCDEGEAYAEKLRQGGTPVAFRCEEHLTHSFTSMMGTVPAARRALEQIADDVAKALES